MAVTRSAHNKANNKSKNLAKQVAAKRVIPKKATQKGIKISNKAGDSISRLRLLDLPLEIRQIIYQYVLVKENRIEIVSPLDTLSRSHPQRRKRKPPKGATSLLQVNKAIHHDAAQYFYENNHFVIRLSVNALHRLDPFTCTEKSITRANNHGFRCFLTRVPRFYVSCIKELTILISFALDYSELWPCNIVSYRMSPSAAYISNSVLRQFQDMTTVTLRRFSGLQVVNIIFNDVDSEREPLDSFRPTSHPWQIEQSLFNSFHNLFQYSNLERITLGMHLQGDPHSYLFCPRHYLTRGGLVLCVIKDSMKRALKNQDGAWESPETNEIWMHIKDDILSSRDQRECESVKGVFNGIFQRKKDWS
ncbi:uncharacterized protein Bfra_004405 [Botrytis fragariae]|uniref:F-box domain-containing protein n=1 Tax=Botrytis fragariae TaxID=1964551 RepID=A0A8H6EJC8_9HELO|nr:uncharacterized protein Bfra_004405 [Botrytis fragariae]KAF5874398.1 hypothetical protein Bfra_004405 [Botrytis fragariae]